MDREEKRRLLRQKIANAKAGRTGGGPNAGAQLAAQVKADPAGALLSLGIDDAAVLSNASSLLNVDKLKQTARSLKGGDREKRVAEVVDDDEEEEEAPPPLSTAVPNDTPGSADDDEEDEEAPPEP